MEVRGQVSALVGIWEAAARGLGQGDRQETSCFGDCVVCKIPTWGLQS